MTIHRTNVVATRIVRPLRLGVGTSWVTCKQRNPVVIEEEMKYEPDRIRDRRVHPAPAVVSVASQLEHHVQLYISCAHQRVCGIFPHLNLS